MGFYVQIMRMLQNCYLYKKKRNKKVNRRKTIKIKLQSGEGKIVTTTRMAQYANQLNNNLPASEIWFQSLLSLEKLPIKFDTNLPIGKYIIDLVNQQFKLAIEVDGSSHNNEIQQFKDRLKDDYLIKRGYRVYRVKAYDVTNFNQVISEVKYFLSLYPNNLKLLGY